MRPHNCGSLSFPALLLGLCLILAMGEREVGTSGYPCCWLAFLQALGQGQLALLLIPCEVVSYLVPHILGVGGPLLSLGCRRVIEEAQRGQVVCPKSLS